MRKTAIFILIAVVIATAFWAFSQQKPDPVPTQEAAAPTAEVAAEHPFLKHRYAGEQTTRRPDALYPEARDIVTALGLSTAELDRMSFEGTNPQLDRYRIEVQVDVKNNEAALTQQLHHTNHSGYDQTELYFHIYPNAFQDQHKAPALLGMHQSYPNGFSPGHLKVESLKVNGKETAFEIISETASVVKLPLQEPLRKGQSITLDFSCALKLPETIERFGHFGGFLNFAHFYPILAVFDDSGWNIDPYHSMGDPFYSDIADYDVSVTIDKTYEVASSGKLLDAVESDALKTYHYKGTNIRSFCFVAYDGWKKVSTMVGPTELISYVKDPATAQPFIDAAASMLKALNTYVGTYPYPTLSFVESEYISGMEWPTLVIIPTGAMHTPSAKGWALEASSHEVAHQYFYGLVGNDQVDEAWLDEGFATYLNYVWHPSYGAFNEEQNDLAMQRVIDASSFYKAYEGMLVKPVDRFTARSDQYWNVYNGGALFLNKLRVHLGDDVFDRGMRTYFERYKYKLADTDEFFAVMEEVSGLDLSDFVALHLKYELR